MTQKLCGKTWTTQGPNGRTDHRCIKTHRHTGRHYCECGVVK